MTERAPSELARETFKLLAGRKLPPTPENYMALYREIAGTPMVLPFADEPLRQIAKALPAQNPGQQKQRALFELAVERRDWTAVQNAMVGFANFGVPQAGTEAAPATRNTLLPGLLVPLTPEFLQQIARLIEHTLPAMGSDDARFSEQSRALLAAMRQNAPDVTLIKAGLANFSHRVSFAAEEQMEIKTALLHLLQLIFQNIGELSPEDRWLTGQIQALVSAATPPLSLRRLDEVKFLLKDVIFKQREAKGRALEAQDQLRQMLSTFIEHLSKITASSSDFHDTIAQCAKEIGAAKTFSEIGPVLESAMNAAKTMAQNSLQVRDELQGMREKTDAAQAQIVQLHQELDRVSAQARHDPLTGALNRQGLDEAIEREVSNARRKQRPLCLALLDIDNFKKINDTLGHNVGDSALAHLATVVRDSLRPQDTLARYGGEEFVVILPDTPLDPGVEAMTRLQRELSKRIFLEGEAKVLITFSAGVAELAPDETGMEAVKRADQAMFLAKRAGKNRVLGA
jgi:diguanylate cyclase